MEPVDFFLHGNVSMYSDASMFSLVLFFYEQMNSLLVYIGTKISRLACCYGVKD